MIGCYWIFLVVAILFAVALVRGTIVDIKNSKNDDKLDAIKKSIDDLVAEIRQDRKERKDRENYDG